MSEPGSRPAVDKVRSADKPADDVLEDPRIFAVVQEYMTQLESGKNPNRAEYVSRYPDLSDAIRQCLEGLEIVRAETPASQSAATRGRSSAVQHAGIDVPANPLGDFQIIRELARGGMGIVYEAVQLSLGRRVALKVLPFAATLDSRQLQRFKTEAQAAALLHHPNIVPVFAVGCERGVHFYAMQLIDGQSLALLIRQLRRQAGFRAPEDLSSASGIHSSHVLGADMISDSRAGTGRAPAAAAAINLLPPDTVSQFHAHLSTQHAGRNDKFFETVARLMLQAAHALEHAHEFGIVHRDIKPGNLLLDGHGVLWVTEFGLAQFHTDTGITRTGDIPGTLRYMSPEQASGQRGLLDQRSDVYSLGATFYEFLTLEPIFRGRDVQYLLNQILHAEPRGLRQIDKTIPVELETIILKSVSKSPADRYRSAGDLAADLQRYLEHKPILARRPTLVDRMHKWSRRHPSVVVAGVLLLLVIAGGLSYTNYRENLRANEAEERFQQARRAVDVLVEVSEGELADNPYAQATRRRLLGIALGYYQDFMEQRRGDTAAQGELAAVQESVKHILNDLRVLQREMHVGLLESPAVPAALTLTQDQQSQVAALLKSRSAERDAFWQEARNLDEEARRGQLVKLAEKYDRALGDILSAGQLERLKQLSIQSQGVFVFKEPEIVETLSISPKQRAAIRAIEHETIAKLFPRDRGRGRGEIRSPPSPELMDEAVLRVVTLFSSDQVNRWQELTGPIYPGAGSLRRQRPPGGKPSGDRPAEASTGTAGAVPAAPESKLPATEP
jgi:serine/threonine protein kinase